MVVILPDSGRNYLSKLYNDEWMRANGLLATTGAVVARRATCWPTATTAADLPDLVLARTTDRVGRGDRPAPASTASASCPVSRRPTAIALDGHRRLRQRAGPARPRLSRTRRSSSGRSAR